MGGTGGGVAYNQEEFDEICRAWFRPYHQQMNFLIDESSNRLERVRNGSCS